MLPFPLFLSAFTDSLFHDDMQDLLLLSLMASLEEDECASDEDNEEEEESEDEYVVESGIEEFEESEDSQEEESEDEPTAPKRRRLYNYASPQQTGAGTSTASNLVDRGTSTSEFENRILQGPISMIQPASLLNTSRVTMAVRTSPPAIVQSSVRQQLVERNEPPTESSRARIQLPSQGHQQNLHSSAQFARPVAQQNSPSDARQISQHNLPQARVVLHLPNIGDMYPREE